MKTFVHIYETLDLSAEAQPRSIWDLRIILAKAYELAKNKFFSSREIFDYTEHSPIALHRTTVQRMMLEVERLEDSKLIFVLTSYGTELLIAELANIEEYINSPSIENEHFDRLVLAGRLKGMIRILVDNTREGVIGTIKQNIMQDLHKLETTEEKVKHLKRTLLSYKQHQAFIDKKQYERLCEFIELEKEKWELDTASTNASDMSKTNHSIAVGAGGIANINYAAGATQAINTGVGAQQNVASGDNATQGISTSSATSLDELLKRLAHLVVTDEAFAVNRPEMEHQLETIKVQLQKTEPKKGIIKRAFESLTELAADGAGVMAGHAVFELLHKVPELLAAAGLN